MNYSYFYIYMCTAWAAMSFSAQQSICSSVSPFLLLLFSVVLLLFCCFNSYRYALMFAAKQSNTTSLSTQVVIHQFVFVLVYFLYAVMLHRLIFVFL